MMQETNFLSVLNCLIHNGASDYLDPKSGKNSCIWRFFWVFIMAALVCAAVVMSVLSCVYRADFLNIHVINETTWYNGVAGISIIGILTAAVFMVYSLFISQPLFNTDFTNERRDVLSLASLIIILQLVLTFICFLDVIFPFDYTFGMETPWIRYGLQVFTVIFMVIADIHLIFHIASVVLSNDQPS